MRKLLLLLLFTSAAFCQRYDASRVVGSVANAQRVGGKPVCSATVKTNCVTATDASGNLQIGPTLPGAVAGGKDSGWNKYTVAFSNAAFLAAATSVSITLGELPVNGVVEAVRIKHSAAFAGTGINAVSCSLGDGTDHTAYATALDVFQAVSNTAQRWDGGANSSTVAAHNLTLRCTANVNFGSGAATVLTAGSVDVHIKVAVLQ